MTATAGIGNRETAIFTFWLYPAIGIPFVILGAWGGFGPAFQGGAASAFMCGAIVAALGECAIDNWKDGFTRFKATRGKARIGAFFALTLVSGFFWWNMYYAVADKTAVHPSVDWVQVTVFLVTAAFLPQARFAFTDMRTPTPKEFFKWYLALLQSIPRGGRGMFRPMPVPVPVQADEPVPAPVITAGEGTASNSL